MRNVVERSIVADLMVIECGLRRLGAEGDYGRGGSSLRTLKR